MITTMSSSGLSSFGEVGQLGVAASRIAQTSATLTQQASDGLISDQVVKLGTSTGLVLNLQPQLAQLSAYATNGNIASSRLSVAATSLSQVSSIATDLSTNLLALRGQPLDAASTTLTTMASAARVALNEVGSLLNTQAGGTYVFGGGDGTTPPITDPSNMTGNALNTAAATAIGSLDTNGASATLQSILTAAGGTDAGSTPFAGSLPTTSQNVLVGAGIEVATATAIAAPTGVAGPTSTGSSVRDLVAVLTTIANMTPANLNSPNINDLLSGLQSVTATAQKGLVAQEAQIGSAQDVVQGQLTLNSSSTTLLSSQLGDLTSVDAAKVSSELSASNEQLQASYMLISDLKNLNLAYYL